ncbi:MAG: prepilin-type N-terminal cleavage/methylation domain-containing protein [Armatimonadota bacterium]
MACVKRTAFTVLELLIVIAMIAVSRDGVCGSC